MPITRKAHPLPIQLIDLVLIQLSNWRWSWRRMIVTGMIAPMASLAALGVFARDSGNTALVYVLVGNVTLALMFETLSKVTSHFAFMRVTGTLYHFATLPVQKSALILATMVSFLLLSLPAVIVTIIFGSWFLGIPIHLHPLIVPVIPLATTPLTGIGAYIGSKAKTPEEASAFSLIITLVFVGLGPVIIPPERLPDIMIFLGRFSPATYAASALRQTLIGPVTGQLWIDLSALMVIAVAIFWLVQKNLAWRQD